MLIIFKKIILINECNFMFINIEVVQNDKILYGSSFVSIGSGFQKS
jgi:hypothetical protein